MSHHNTGLARKFASFYVLFAVIMLIASTVSLNPFQVSYSTDIWFPLFWIVSSVGVMKYKVWGMWSSYLISVVISIFGFPVLTVFGVAMIWALYLDKDSFNSW